MTILIVFGKWGGIYFLRNKGWSFRIALGWVAITIFWKDVEELLQKQIDLEKGI